MDIYRQTFIFLIPIFITPFFISKYKSRSTLLILEPICRMHGRFMFTNMKIKFINEIYFLCSEHDIKSFSSQTFHINHGKWTKFVLICEDSCTQFINVALDSSNGMERQSTLNTFDTIEIFL